MFYHYYKSIFKTIYFASVHLLVRSESPPPPDSNSKESKSSENEKQKGN